MSPSRDMIGCGPLRARSAGVILDRDGEPLARSSDAYHLTADQTLVTNPAAYALQLDGLLAADARSIQRALTGERRFQYVAKELTPQTWRAIDELDLQGIYAEPAAQREYPAGAVAGNVVGFVGAEGHGLAGVELSMDSLLSGVDGEMACQLSAGGHCIPLGNGTRRAAVPGEGVRLTLDRDVQWYAEQALSAGRRRGCDRRQRGGHGYPDVRDHRHGDGAGRRPERARCRRERQPGQPGSRRGLRAGVCLQAAHHGGRHRGRKGRPGTVLSVPDHVERSGEVINDYYDHGEEQMTLAGILAKSSNVGTLLAAERIDKDIFRNHLVAFGLGARPGLGLPGERRAASGGLGGPDPRHHRLRSGRVREHGPDGFGVRHHRKRGSAAAGPAGRRHHRRGRQETAAATGAPVRVVSEQTAAAVTLMMEAVMGEDGTGGRAAVDGYRVAGKTGTAQRVDVSCGCYRGYNSSFMGFAPADDPRYVVAVSVLNPRNGNSGGALAGPVFADVMRFTLAQMGVAPTGTEAPELPLFAD